MKSKDYFSDEFKFPEELNLKLPLLILAIEVPLYETEKPKEEAIKDRCYNFKGPERWIMLAHQTGGMHAIITTFMPVFLNLVLIATRYRDFEEGIYPRDCESKNLKLLCEDELPEDLNEFIEWEDDWDRLIGIIGRWKLFILGENCD